MNGVNKIIIVIFFLLALGLGVGLVQPKYQTLKILKATIAEKEKELQTKTDYFFQIKKTAQDLLNYSGQLLKIKSALPSTPSLPSLFHFLQTTAAESGLVLEKIELSDITLPKETQDGGIKEIGVNLQLAGSYASLKNFLLILEKSARLLEVTNISFASPQELKKAFSFGLNLKTHSY